ncbi:MAG: hypothetical protein AAF479_05340 [Pseudomonadota bacterium]
MKTLVVLSALAAALVTAPVTGFTAPAQAAAKAGVELKQTESTSVSAVRALITRCLPSVLSGKGIPTSGLAAASKAATRQMIGSRNGSVWMDTDAKFMMVDFHDVPSCKVIALTVDPGVLADLVMRVFSEAKTPFTRERFRMDEDGGFSAVYSSAGKRKGVVIRISTAEAKDGGRFATLSVEQDMRETAKVEE